jgi:hypothetical protein
LYRKEEERKQEIRKTGMEITKINQHFTYYIYWLIDPCIFLIRSMRLKGPNVEKRRHVCINQLISMFSVPMSLLQRERLVFHACSNQKHFYKVENYCSPYQNCLHKNILFCRYIISQNTRGLQLCQVINQQSNKNIYILAWTIRTRYDYR